ncbi:MAG: hypothetical protein JWN87_1654 [Frankiales bacterium]|jgi:hypothetical protein|nr:hypothetical protein [Frankiales bacterium]
MDQRVVTRWEVNRPVAASDLQHVTPELQEERVSPMALLESGIPLSLLLDLVCGPHSADLLDHERTTSPVIHGTSAYRAPA